MTLQTPLGPTPSNHPASPDPAGPSAHLSDAFFPDLSSFAAAFAAPADSPASDSPLLDAAALDRLERNLQALGPASAAAVQAIRAAAPHPSFHLIPTPQDVPAATLGDGADARQLCSLRRPLDEAAAFAAAIDPTTTAGVAVLGFGMGWHLRALAERFGSQGVLIACEPDIALLRSVLSAVDHSDWLARTNFILLTDPDDQPTLTAAVRGVEAVLMLGTRLVEHLPSRARLAPAAPRFAAAVAAVLRAVRTHIVTTLIQVETTVRNLMGNLPAYADAPGVADLAGVAAHQPAVVVSAGPSLARNLHLLQDPAYRRRVIVIAVQTVLKTLLQHGIKPDFVTALDHAALSARFYENLDPAAVADVNLVVEPKASPAIFSAYPGPLRCPAEPILDAVLGPALSRPMGTLPPGATVAHLAYYLARHLGCDPVILIGQDLGFTDGQYYAAHAAIHQVWSSELNDFNTLEMLEWQRIVRQRSLLHRATDQLGRPIYTDEQMATYLNQFERDFAADARRGLTTIDATEGGVAKRHTTIQPFAAALAALPDRPALVPPAAPAFSPAEQSARRALLADRMTHVRQQIDQIAAHSRRTADLLAEMRDHHADQSRVNRLITQVQSIAAQVHALEPGHALVQHLNQTGVLNRYKADRLIKLAAHLSPLDRQRRQIDRDHTNVTWLADSAATLSTIFSATLDSLLHPTSASSPSSLSAIPSASLPPSAPATRARVAAIRAVIPVDLAQSALCARDLTAPLLANDPSSTPLHLTLRRLAASRSLGGALLLTHEPERVRDLLNFPAFTGSIETLPVTIVPLATPALSTRLPALRAARAIAASCWRGGLANLSAWDEAFPPAALAAALDHHQLSAALLVGADWALIAPDLIDTAIARHTAEPDPQPLVFAPAAVGLGPCLLSADLLRELCVRASDNGPHASIGALLGYLPIAPQADPIARAACLPLPPAARDLARRCAADTPAGRDLLAGAISTLARDLGPDWTSAPLDVILAALTIAPPTFYPELLDLEFTTRRLAPSNSSVSSALHRRAWEDPALPLLDLSPAALNAFLNAYTAAFPPPLAINLAGRGDPLAHPDFDTLLTQLRAAFPAAAIHLRTDLAAAPVSTLSSPADLFARGINILSVDLLAANAATRATLAPHTTASGADAFALVESHLAALPRQPEGLTAHWLVPRLTRCDQVYAELEHFYDRYVLLAGSCVIDPLPAHLSPDFAAPQRITPLPRPSSTLQRDHRTRLALTADAILRAADAAPLLSLSATPSAALAAALRSAWTAAQTSRQPSSQT